MSVPSASAGSPVRLLPAEPSPFGVYLLRRASPSSGDPFVTLGLEPGQARTYAAVLRSESGAELARLVLKLPGDERDEAPFPDQELLSNKALEEEWAAARRDLERLLAAPDAFPELVLPAGGAAGEAALLPPTFFCPTAGVLFPIPCPRCFGTLRTCRDDAVLAAAGLPLFSSTAARFLTCPACAGEDEAGARFWAGSADEARGLGDQAGSLDDLRRQLATALKRREGAPGVPATPASGWLVLNLHDAPYLLTRMAPLPFDLFLERLGGVPEEGEESAGLLFAAEGSGIDAVEVLALKLAAFLQVVNALRQHYLLLGRPHLDLHPDHLVVEPGPRGDFLPHLWSFRVKLLGGSPGRVARLAPDLEVPLPPRAPRPPFASPGVRLARLAAPSVGELVVDRAVEEKRKGQEKGQSLWRIEGTLLDPHGFYPPPSLRDCFQLALPRETFEDVRAVVARLDPRVAPQSMQVSLTTEPLALDPALVRRLGRPGGVRVPGVRYRIYPALSAPEDLWSLGVLLLRMVLVDDKQGLSALEPLLERAQRGEGLSSLLAAEPEKLSKVHLFHRALDRTPGRPSSVPDDLWTGVLALAMRLVARGPGFGLTAEPGGSFAYDETHPVSHLDAVRAQIEDLLRQMNAVLFQRQPVHAEIRSVIAELLAEEKK